MKHDMEYKTDKMYQKFAPKSTAKMANWAKATMTTLNCPMPIVKSRWKKGMLITILE